MVCAPEFWRAHQSLGAGSPRSSELTVVHPIEADGDFTRQRRHLLGFPNLRWTLVLSHRSKLQEAPARARALLGFGVLSLSRRSER